MPTKLLATTIIIAAILASVVSTICVEVVDANPLPWAFNPQMTVSILSPQNGTISSLPVLVSFTSQADNQFSVSDDTSEEWVRSFFYVLDGQDMKTMGMRFEGTNTTTIYANGSQQGFRFDGQTYLTNLADGPHNITVYQESIYYTNPAWQATSQFYVDSKLTTGLTITPSPTPNTTTLMPTVNTGPHVDLAANSFLYIVGIVAMVIVLIVGLLVYVKKRKYQTN
jgi:hypothetical protein